MKEFELIADIRKRAGKPEKPVSMGIGDDCAVLEKNADEYMLWASDMIIEGTHFKRMDGYVKIGEKAVSVNVSDVAAMGGIPEYILISLGVPRWTSSAVVKGIYKGIFRTCAAYGIKVLGGDTVRSGRIVVDVSILGSVEKKNLTLRSGAKKGDLVLITGPIRNGRKCHLSFKPRSEESRFLVENYKVNSMIDTSDGIGVDVSRICSESLKGCMIYENALPLSKGLSLKDALYYGESFELLFTMSKKEVKRLFSDKRLAKKTCPFYIIGEITGKASGRKLIKDGGIEEDLRVEGYRHI